jgi:Protein of unknown function (DUF1254)
MTGGWETVRDALAAAQVEIATAAPDLATAAEGEAYIARVLTACLNDAFLGHLMTDGGLIRALPTRGGPNPDYLISHAPMDAARRYCLRGRMNDSERVGVGLYSVGPSGSAVISRYAAVDRATAGPNGSFEFEIAAEPSRPGALAILPDARILIVRILHRDTKGEPARVTLEGGPPVRDLALAKGSADAALAQAAQGATNAVRQFLEWSAVTSVAPNRFLSEPPKLTQGLQGDPDTVYHLGYYQLEDGQWLEVTMPDGLTGYWSVHAYNHWCEALPGAGAHDRNTVRDSAGRIRIAIGPNPPQNAPNRIDTIGRRRGVLICRIIGATNPQVPTTKICLADSKLADQGDEGRGVPD